MKLNKLPPKTLIKQAHAGVKLINDQYPEAAAILREAITQFDVLREVHQLAKQEAIPEQTEREQIRREHAKWSDATFGNVGPVGPLKHLSKQAIEAAADPSDPLEWADMQFLLWDAQRRIGISDDFITKAMIEKLEINKKRQWPEPKDGEPRLHINTQSAQPVSEPYKLPIEAPYGYFAFNQHHGEEFFKKCADAIEFCKAAIEDYRRENAEEGCDPAEVRRTCWGIIMQHGTDIVVDDVGHIDYSLTPELSTNSPVIPDGWKLVPIEPTENMIIEGFESEPDKTFSKPEVWEEYAAMSGCKQAAHRAKLCWAAMLAAAPEQETNND